MNSKEHRARLPLWSPRLLAGHEAKAGAARDKQQTMARSRDTLDDMTGGATAMPDSRTVEPQDATDKTSPLGVGRRGRGSLGLGLSRVRWFEIILIGYVALWGLVIWSAGDPPRFFL